MERVDVYDETIRSAPAAAVGVWLAELGDGARRALLEKGVVLADLVWLVPVRGIRTVTGETLDAGFLGMDQASRVHLFRYGSWRGLYCMSVPASSVFVSVFRRAARVVLTVELRQTVGAARAEVEFGPHPGKFDASWPKLFRLAFAHEMGVGEDVPMTVGAIKRFDVLEGGFGTRTAREDGAVVLAFVDGELKIFSGEWLSSPRLLEWYWDGCNLELLFRCGSSVSLIQIREYVGTLGCRCAVLPLDVGARPPELESTASLLEPFMKKGVFSVRLEGDSIGSKRVLSKEIGAVSILNDDLGVELSMTHYFAGDGWVMLASLREEVALVCLGSGDTRASTGGAPPFSHLTLLNDLMRRDDGTFWCPVICEETTESSAPLCFALHTQSCELGNKKEIPLASREAMSVATNIDEQMSRVSLPLPDVSADAATVLRLPSKLAYRIWEEYDAVSIERRLAAADFPELYRLRNEAWRRLIMTLLFGEIASLNQTMNRGITLAQAMEKVELTANQNEVDSALKQAVVEKILVLVMTVPRLKQSYEILSAIFPYHWADMEGEWLRDAFGDMAQSEIATCRKRLVPVIRRQIREITANISRAIGEIESAARPVDALLSRAELSNSLPVRLGRFMPQLIQIGSGVALAMLGIRTSFPPWLYFATALGGGVLGDFFRKTTADAEASSQIIRAARIILPWWNVLDRMLTVSIYETSQFVDEQNVLSMRRDRVLFGRLPDAARSDAVKKLSVQLRRQIMYSRRAHFAEIDEGSGVRAIALIREIEGVVMRNMREFVGPSSVFASCGGLKLEEKELSCTLR